VVANSKNTFKMINEEIIKIATDADRLIRRLITTKTIPTQGIETSKNSLLMSQKYFGSKLSESLGNFEESKQVGKELTAIFKTKNSLDYI
jgi:hypothetical protein